METLPPLELDYFLDLNTDLGWKIRDFEPINGHHLVYKIPIPERTSGNIILPPGVRKKAVRNVTMIRGFVLRASAPWRRKRSIKRIVWDQEGDCWKVDWKILEGAKALDSDISAGSGVLYTSYNMGKVFTPALPEPLVVIREIDIDAAFAPGEISRVNLGQKAMT